jgi:phospholipase/carboxylesterase
MFDGTEPTGQDIEGLGVSVDGEAAASSTVVSETWRNPCGGGNLDSGEAAAYCAVHLPIGFEPDYTYPLIVWFHDEGADEQEMLSLLPYISDRNYAGLSLRAPLPVTNGVPRQRRWSLAEGYLNILEAELAVSLERLAERIRIHGERVIAAGMGQGASVALRMLLRRPEWFAGGVCLNAEWDHRNRFEWWGQYAQKPLWLGQIVGWASSSTAAIVRTRLLRAAGFEVHARWIEFGDAKPRRLGTEIDRWLMQRLCPYSVVL